jgi:hypothetical protein
LFLGHDEFLNLTFKGIIHLQILQTFIWGIKYLHFIQIDILLTIS